MRKIFSNVEYNSPVVLTYTFLALIVFILSVLTGGRTNTYFFSLYPSELSIPFFIRTVGYILGHANTSHLFSNFVMILLVGPVIEEKYGSVILGILIFITAIVTAIIGLFILRDNEALLGASGIAFMFIALMSFTSVEKNKIPLTFILVILFFLGQEIYAAIFVNDNVSRSCHIIGLFCGAVYGLLFNKYGDKGKLKTEDNNGINEYKGF